VARLKAAYFNAYFSAVLRGKPPVRFAVVTACDPMGREAPPAVNRRRDAALLRRLKALKIARFRVTGGNKAGSHREPGWGLIVKSPKSARALAAEFRQDAFYWISSGRIYLGAAAGGPLKRAGSWGARQAAW
jgi:hypothetical protein